MSLKVAFWRGTDPGLSGVVDRAIRWWTKSEFSHCELVFSDGWAAVTSWDTKKLVWMQRPEYDPKDWVLVDVPHDEARCRAWVMHHLDLPYDLFGAFGFVWRPLKGLDGALFCSEEVAACFGWTDPWSYSPGMLYNILTGTSREELLGDPFPL